MRTSTRALRAIALGVCLAVGLRRVRQFRQQRQQHRNDDSQHLDWIDNCRGDRHHRVALVLGGPPECPTRPYCEIGLTKTYGLTFKSFKPLDAGGPLTVAALKSGSIQVGLLFTTSGAIAGNGWVLLKDDKNLQPADNVTPVLNNKITTAYGKPLEDLVNGVSAKITTQVLTDLNKSDRHRPEGSRRGRQGVAAVEQPAADVEGREERADDRCGLGELHRRRHARGHLRRLAAGQRLSGVEEAQHRSA